MRICESALLVQIWLSFKGILSLKWIMGVFNFRVVCVLNGLEEALL